VGGGGRRGEPWGGVRKLAFRVLREYGKFSDGSTMIGVQKMSGKF
jgi:hypothetical protein